MASRSWNRVELIGNLTRDPEIRYTPSGAAVCTFSVATNRTFVSEGERKEEADFHRIVSWNKLAELCSQLLKKGNRVFVSGRLQNRSWEGQDGQTRQTTEIVIEDMILLTSKSPANDFEEASDANEFKAASQPPPKKPVPASDNTTDEPHVEEAITENKESKPTKEVKEEVDVDDLPF